MTVSLRHWDAAAPLELASAMLEGGPDVTADQALVCVGDDILVDDKDGYLRGHGTMLQEQEEEEEEEGGARLASMLCGAIMRINKLVAVKPFNSRYGAELGDVVVGRVTELQARRWAVDIGAATRASLQLGAVALPGDLQRRRTAEDELAMREWYREGDAIVAEIQQINKKDQSIALSMRGRKFTKLRKGRLVEVPASCVRRTASHFVELRDEGIQIVTGCNGWLWLGVIDCNAAPEAAGGRARPFGAAASVDAAVPEFTAAPEQWAAVAMHAQAAHALAQLRLPVHAAALRDVVALAAQNGVSCAGMLNTDFLFRVIELEQGRRGGTSAAMDEG